MGGKDDEEGWTPGINVMERWAYRYPEFLLSASTAGTPDFEEMFSE